MNQTRTYETLNAFFVSEWGDGSVVISPCVVSLDTKQVTVLCCADVNPGGGLVREHIEDANGAEIGAVYAQDVAGDNDFWYEG